MPAISSRPAPIAAAAIHGSSTVAKPRIAAAIRAPTPYSAITPAPPNMPAPLPAWRPFSVSSACARRISWRISVDVWRDRSWTSSPSGLSPSDDARKRVEVSIQADYPACEALCNSGGFLQPGHLAGRGQPLERLVLDAANPFGRQPEPLPGLAQRRGLVPVDAVAEPDHLLLLLGQARERPVHGLLPEADLDLLDRLGRVAREERAELGVALRADGPLEARDRPAELARLLELAEADVCLFGDLLVRGRAPQAHRQVAVGARDLPLALADVHREPDRPALVREAALDGLADPEGRVRGELVALAPVELLRRADQAQNALLDQVEERQLVALVALRERHHEPEVRVHHPLLGLEVAALDPLGELDLLVGREERVPADVAQEELERVAGHVSQLVDRVRRARLGGATAVVRHLDAARLEAVGERLRLVLGQVLRELRELGQVDASLLLAAVDEGVQCGGGHGCRLPDCPTGRTRTSAPRRPWASDETRPSSSHMTKKAAAY